MLSRVSKDPGLCAVLSLLIVVVTAAGCRAPSAEITYYLAVIDGDALGVASDECEIEGGAVVTYRYPSGRQVTVRVSREPVLAVPLDDSVTVRLVDFGSAHAPQVQAVVADLIPPSEGIARAVDLRQPVHRCDLLIMLNNEAVGLERRGTDWGERLPGGSFQSMSVAQRAFSNAGAVVVHELAPAEEVKAADDYWAWRTRKDVIDFHCDATLRETIRERDPILFGRLESIPAPDCERIRVGEESPMPD